MGMMNSSQRGPHRSSRYSPGDELYDGMPEHVQKLYRDAKAISRAARSSAFLDRQNQAPAGLRGPEAMLDFIQS
jgi:hypothetical protein